MNKSSNILVSTFLLLAFTAIWISRPQAVLPTLTIAKQGVFATKTSAFGGREHVMMRWVDDIDGDQFPDLIVQEKGQRNWFGFPLRSNAVVSNQPSQIHLLSGRSGKVIDQIKTVGERGTGFVFPFGILPSTGKIAALQSRGDGSLRIFDGVHEVGIIEDMGSGAIPSWTVHPGTGQIVDVRDAKSAVELVDLATGRVLHSIEHSRPEAVGEVLWLRSRNDEVPRWYLLISLLEDVDLKLHVRVFVIDWGSNRVVADSSFDASDDLPSAFPCLYSAIPPQSVDQHPHPVQLWAVGDEYTTPIRIETSFGNTVAEAGFSLFIVATGRNDPGQIQYINYATNEVLWAHALDSLHEKKLMRRSTMSILNDHNSDEIPEIAIEGFVKSSKWLGVKFSTPTKITCLLDGATGEVLHY